MKKLLFFALILVGCAKSEIETEQVKANEMVIDGVEMNYTGSRSFTATLLPIDVYDCEYRFYTENDKEYISVSLRSYESDLNKIIGRYPINPHNKLPGNIYSCYSDIGDIRIVAKEGFVEFELVDGYMIVTIEATDGVKSFYLYSKTINT